MRALFPCEIIGKPLSLPVPLLINIAKQARQE
jgi:hypothetical protein